MSERLKRWPLSALSAMTKTVEKLDHTMNNPLMGRIELPSRRSQGASE